MAAAAGVPWVAVPHLRRFFGGVVDAARNGSGVRIGEDEVMRAILEPTLLAVAAYQLEDETAAAVPQNIERLFREAGEIWEALERFPVDRRHRVVELLPSRCRSWALAVRACEASLKAAADKPADALELAALALAVAEQLPADIGGYQLQGFCWAHLANARRVSTDFGGAHEGFARAWKLWRAGEAGETSRLPEWCMLSLESSLRREQRLFPEALDLIDRALALSGGEPAVMARCLLKKENVYEVAGDVRSALAVLAEAVPLVEAAGDQHLLLALRFKTANNLYHLQRFAEAADLLPEIRIMAHQQGAELDGLRVGWLAGRVAAGLGRRAEAIAGLEGVRKRFTDLLLPYEAALSSLDLAALWLEEGRSAEVREIAVAMAWIFKAKGIQREALVALQLFRRAAERDAATVELAQQVIAKIEALRRE
jgi:tetratricopeptide (TPR) repeat protein